VGKKPSSLFFFLFSLCFVVSGCKWAPSSTFNRGGAQAPFFLFPPFVLLLLGVSGLHCQLSTRAPSFFFFFFFYCLWV